MRHAPRLLWAALLAAFLPAAPVRADFIPWKYSWSRSPSIIYSDSSNNSYIYLSEESPLVNAGNNTWVVATNLSVVSDADPEDPATFTNKPYTLTLFLLDVQSNASGTLDFSGVLNGTISQFTADVTTQFTSLTNQQLTLGTHLYDITIGPYAPPGPPEANQPGAISGHVMVRVTDIQKTPEPSSLILAALGVPLGYRLLRRRAARKQASRQE